MNKQMSSDLQSAICKLYLQHHSSITAVMRDEHNANSHTRLSFPRELPRSYSSALLFLSTFPPSVSFSYRSSHLVPLIYPPSRHLASTTVYLHFRSNHYNLSDYPSLHLCTYSLISGKCGLRLNLYLVCRGQNQDNFDSYAKWL